MFKFPIKRGHQMNITAGRGTLIDAYFGEYGGQHAPEILLPGEGAAK